MIYVLHRFELEIQCDLIRPAAKCIRGIRVMLSKIFSLQFISIMLFPASLGCKFMEYNKINIRTKVSTKMCKFEYS